MLDDYLAGRWIPSASAETRAPRWAPIDEGECRLRAQGDRWSKRRSTPIDELDGEQCCSPRAAVLIAAWWLMAL